MWGLSRTSNAMGTKNGTAPTRRLGAGCHQFETVLPTLDPNRRLCDGESMGQVDLKSMFGVDDQTVQDANDILRPWENLVPIKIKDHEIMLPENNSLWRGMQFWGLMTGEIRIDFSLFCIAGTCKNCKLRMIRAGSTERESALACQTIVEPGLQIRKMPMGFDFRPKRRDY